jgi:hypothetical protein
MIETEETLISLANTYGIVFNNTDKKFNKCKILIQVFNAS